MPEYLIVAPLVVAHRTQGEHARTYHYGGTLLPQDVLPEQLEQLIEQRMVEPVTAVEVVAPVVAVEVARPAKTAPKSEWVAYAVAQGEDESKAESMTKADLVETFGGEPEPEQPEPPVVVLGDDDLTI